MTNSEKYKKIFTTLFNISEEEVEDLIYQGIDTWDSVGHMSLISELEENFDIMMDTDDIIDFSSYKKGKEILSENYQIKFQEF